MFLPYKVDVPMARWPWANWLIMLATIIISICLFGAVNEYQQSNFAYAWLGMTPPPAEGILQYFLLQPANFHPAQLVGNLFTHAGWLHLAGNMLFLWVFGNAVNAKIGQWQYLLLYLGIGILESLTWVALGPRMPALGASGAIMGIMGAFLLLYPTNDISCVFSLGYFTRTVEFAAGWLIALYAILDFYGAVFQRHAGVGYFAHVIGFLLGAGTLVALLFYKWLEPVRGERTLLQILGRMPDNPDDVAPIRDSLLPKPNRPAQLAPPSAAPRRSSAKPRDNSPIPLD